MENRAVIVFLKAPEKDQVKTRLSRSLNSCFILDLYKAFVEDILAAVKNQGRLYLYFWPPREKAVFYSWLGNEYSFLPQKGGDLGQKMASAFKDVFAKNADQAVLIGTDVPQLDSSTIASGFSFLEKKDAVIGPSSDGGYYLIGFNKDKFSNIVFQNIDWSTHRVFDQTLAAMKKVSIMPGFLQRLNDVDTPQDLEKLTREVSRGRFVGPRTRRLILPDDC